MSDFRERLNAHLPILLQLVSTTALVAIALSSLCASKSLKKLSGALYLNESTEIKLNNFIPKDK